MNDPPTEPPITVFDIYLVGKMLCVLNAKGCDTEVKNPTEIKQIQNT